MIGELEKKILRKKMSQLEKQLAEVFVKINSKTEDYYTDNYENHCKRSEVIISHVTI